MPAARGGPELPGCLVNAADTDTTSQATTAGDTLLTAARDTLASMRSAANTPQS